MRRALVLASVLVVGCNSAELAPPRVDFKQGAATTAPRKLVALAATCGGLLEPVDPKHAVDPQWLRGICPKQALEGVDQTVRSSLEFRGLTVIDAEKVNAITASRREITLRHEQRGATSESEKTEVAGSLFEDATPKEQVELLRELGAEGVVTVRIFVGSSLGIGSRRVVIAQVRLRTAPEGTLVWARRCELEVGVVDTDAVAMNRAAKCAVEGAQ